MKFTFQVTSSYLHLCHRISANVSCDLILRSNSSRGYYMLFVLGYVQLSILFVFSVSTHQRWRTGCGCLPAGRCTATACKRCVLELGTGTPQWHPLWQLGQLVESRHWVVLQRIQAKTVLLQCRSLHFTMCQLWCVFFCFFFFFLILFYFQ